MAAITSNAVTGNWNDTGSWVGGVIPVSGDTVTLADSAIITVPVGYTAVCGSSPADDTGTPAIQCASTSGTGRLIINGTFKYQGPVREANANWVVGPGATVTYDASAASTPASALYTWQIGQAANQANAYLSINGTSGSHVTWNSVGNVASGGFARGTVLAGSNNVRATFCDFFDVGPATTSGNFANFHLGANCQFYLDDCTTTRCAQIQGTGPFAQNVGFSPSSTFRLLRTKITAPSNTSFTVNVTTGGNVLTTGQRLIQNCDIAGKITIITNNNSGVPDQSSFTIKRNILRCRDLSTGAMSNVFDIAGGGVSEWSENLLAMITASTGTVQDPTVNIGAGTHTKSYLMRMPVPTSNGANMHPIYLDQRSGDVILDGWVMCGTMSDTGGDVVNLTREATAARVVKVINTIYGEGSAGNALGSFVNQQGAVNQTLTKITFDHNTCLGTVPVPNTGLVWGVGAEGGATWPAGAVDSIRSNILDLRTSGTATVANSATPSATVNNGAVVVADYNATHNVTGTIYGNPSGQFASTPGTHDISADPQFVSRDRNILVFDQGYLGQPVGTGWVTATAYAVGDIVSASTTGWFNSATQNWRCVVAHTSGSTTKPGSGANFPSNWEPACLKTISDSLLAGTTYAGGTTSIVGELVNWERAGKAPQNTAYRNAGHDGVTIGAVEGAWPAGGVGKIGAGLCGANPLVSFGGLAA